MLHSSQSRNVPPIQKKVSNVRKYECNELPFWHVLGKATIKIKDPIKQKEHFAKHHPNNEFKRAWSNVLAENAETIEPTKNESLTYC
jgi:hypothetical protein